MSDNRFTLGWIGELDTPLTAEEQEAVNDRLYNEGVGLEVNYEGTLLIMTTKDERLDEGFGLHVLQRGTESDLFVLGAKHDQPVVFSSIRPFIDLWYDGADSTHSTLTLKEFREQAA